MRRFTVVNAAFCCWKPMLFPKNVKPRPEKFLYFSLSFQFFFLLLHPTKPVTRGRAGQWHWGNPEADKTVCQDRPKEKGRFRTLLSVCSNFATLNPSTEVMQLKRPRGWIISRPFINYLLNLWCNGCVYYIISLGVGWLALLILTWRQCEGLNIGIGTEELTPTSFSFPTFK